MLKKLNKLYRNIVLESIFKEETPYLKDFLQYYEDDFPELVPEATEYWNAKTLLEDAIEEFLKLNIDKFDKLYEILDEDTWFKRELQFPTINWQEYDFNLNKNIKNGFDGWNTFVKLNPNWNKDLFNDELEQVDSFMWELAQDIGLSEYFAE